LIPREARFFELFGKEAALVSESLTELSSSLAGGVSSHPRLRDLEHECDDVARDIYKLTNLTFTTPLERDDILRLTGCLDDVVDLAEEISDKVDLYRAAPIPDSAKQLGECLAQAGAQIEKAISNLEKPETLAPVLQEIHRLENDGDQISREALRRLFNGSNQKPADVIKWKDLYDLLEATIDQCESVAEVIETIALKNG
jgi:predicted phosphate transport protein (TIGR00153 family)